MYNDQYYLMQDGSSSPSSSSSTSSSSSPSSSRRRTGTQGAIIESMQHHGKGVFSGTFSGTLNPALQDRFGRPKRDISTIIHILNDLLCATPQYRRQRQPQPQIKVQTHENSSMAPIDTSGTTTELVSVENEATRGKLERLRMVMEQNRARRRAKREAKAIDNTTNDINNEDDLENNNQDGTDLMEISPPEPVVA
ncbi:hypothetical protein RUM44_000006 [Polyplax serrata]|uniref:Uncharacterized protein n=1 Tax=Polyplax serrata TaxID=468196 RepID=A0ABR1B4A6_POLSC